MTADLTGSLISLVGPLSEALVHFVWQGGLVALLLSGILRLLHDRPADLRYRWACWALLLAVALPIGTTVVRLRTADPSVVTATAGAARVDERPGSLTTSATIEQDGAAPLAGSVPTSLSAHPVRTTWICAVWLGGVLLLSALHLGGWFRVQRLRWHLARPVGPEWQAMADRLAARLGLKRAVRLLGSAAVEIPTAFGWLRPVVLVPVSTLAGLPPQQIECLLAHELAHIWRRDYLVNLLQVVAETLLFYHPAVWWISQRIRDEREHACDDIAVELTGNRLAYARTLVDLEELRLASPRLALGADGGSLVRRIRRITGGPDMNPSNRPLLAAALAVAVLLGFAVIGTAAQNRQVAEPLGAAVLDAADTRADARTADRDRDRDRDRENDRKRDRDRDDRRDTAWSVEADGTLRGSWTAERRRGDDVLQIRLRGKGVAGDMGTHVLVDDFTGLDFEEDDEFTLRREAGVFEFEGDFDRAGRYEEGSGRFVFTADEDFAAGLEDLKVRGLDEMKLMVLALQDLSLATVEGLDDLGYRRLQANKLVAVAIFEVTPAYVDEMAEAGFSDLSLDKLIAMRVHDVDAEFATDMADAGFRADDADDLVAWAVHDISPDYANEMEEAGFGRLSPEKLLAYKIHGIDGDYLEELRDAGLPTDDKDQALAFKIHGVDADFIEELREAGLPADDPDEILSFRIHNVTGRHAAAIRARFGRVDADQLLAARIHDVDEEFIDGLAELGYDDVDLEDLIACRIHGVTPRYIRSLEKKGLRRFTLKELIRLRISGVDL